MLNFDLHLQVLEEICICSVVFNDRVSAETTITHLLINWPSPTAEFYTSRTSQSELAVKHAFSVHLLQDDPLLHHQHGAVSANVGKGAEFKFGQREGGNSRESETTPAAFLQTTAQNSTAADVAQFGAMLDAPPPFNVSWGSVSCQSHIGPAHIGHRTYVYRLSPSGDILALAVNERNPKNIRVLFFSPLTPGELSSSVYPIGDVGTGSGR